MGLRRYEMVRKEMERIGKKQKESGRVREIWEEMADFTIEF